MSEVYDGDTVKAYIEAETATTDYAPDESCGDLVPGYDEDGPTAYECGAPLHHTPTGYHCDKGHSYTYAAERHAQGWDYADDATEAQLLAQAGVTGVRPRDSRPWL